MPSIPKTMIGMATITIHAPWVNFTDAMTTSTTAVVVAPMPLTMAERSQPRSRSRSHRRTMPVWLRVKLRNTPTTYS